MQVYYILVIIYLYTLFFQRIISSIWDGVYIKLATYSDRP